MGWTPEKMRLDGVLIGRCGPLYRLSMAEGGMLRRKSARVIAEPLLAVNSGCSCFLPGRAISVIALLH